MVREKGLWRRWAAPFAAVVMLVAPAMVRAEAAKLLGVRFGGNLTSTRVVLDLSSRVTPVVTAAGDRLVINLGATPESEVVGGTGKGLVVRWARAGEDRLELTLAESAHIAHRFAIPPGQGAEYWRYVVDLEPGAEVAQLSATPPLQEKVKAPGDGLADGVGRRREPSIGVLSDTMPAPEIRASHVTRSGGRASFPQEEGPASDSDVENLAPAQARHHQKARQLVASAHAHSVRKVVVIDAGHGGHDSGALGASHQEKELTLAAALVLKEKLERSGRYKVILTRDSDVFIPLADRVKIARRGGVDLFLSLHADSAGADTSPRGASVYTLSDSGVDRAHYVIGHDEWFTKVAARSGQPGVSQILLDLSQRSTRNHSSMFADLLLQKLGGRGVDLLPRSHRDAGYFVLLAPDVPAALLEMGFVTNPEDEARLADAKARGRMMDAVADAIDAYFDVSRGTPTPPKA